MKTKVQRYGRCVALLGLLAVAGCKTSLYTQLTEIESNQMLALLLVNRIKATRQIISTGNITILVDEADFVKAVEILRQQGYPKRSFSSVNEVFPSGQLVTSPAQEQAKLNYIKEQRVEEMLSEFDGVLSAKVVLAEATITKNNTAMQQMSAAVFIKHSPSTNFEELLPQIKTLVQRAVPELELEAIAVGLQAADYRIAPVG